MTQLTLKELTDGHLEKCPGPIAAPPRDPETAESLYEWCQLYQAKHGQKPTAGQQVAAMDRHGWGEAAAQARAKRALRKAIRGEQE